MAVANLHLTPDRQPCQHPTTEFLTGRMPFLLHNQQCQSTEGQSLPLYTTHNEQNSVGTSAAVFGCYESQSSGMLKDILRSSDIHTQTQHTIVLRLYGFCPGQPGEPVPEETFTDSHLSWSSVMPYLLHTLI